MSAQIVQKEAVSTHSRPKAAGKKPAIRAADFTFQLTAARRRLAGLSKLVTHLYQFQLTAARRRLAINGGLIKGARMFQLTAARRRLAYTLAQYAAHE